MTNIEASEALMSCRPVTIRLHPGQYRVTAVIKRQTAGKPYFTVECKDLVSKSSFIVVRTQDIKYA